MSNEKAILTELTELGFTNPKREDIDDTVEAIFEQVENDDDLGVRMIRVLSLHAAPNGFCKDNYDEVLEDWVFEKAEALHGIDANYPYM